MKKITITLLLFVVCLTSARAADAVLSPVTYVPQTTDSPVILQLRMGAAIAALVGGSGGVSDITIHDPNTPSQKLGIDASGRITIANATIGATQSGTYTVQPGNTPNTAPWLVAVQGALPAGTNVIGGVKEADGDNIALGAKADAAVTNPASSASVIAALKGIITQLQAAQPAGANLMGKVGIDQTTPGTTNGVQVNAALPTGTNVIGETGIDQTTPGTTNGVQVTGGAADANNNVIAIAPKPIAASTYSPSVFSNYGANATLNVKASTGNVYSLDCSNANAAARYLQLHNTATTPPGGATPIYSFLVPSSGQIWIGTDFFTNGGVNFSSGIAFAFSTTQSTYTAGTAADQVTHINYK